MRTAATKPRPRLRGEKDRRRLARHCRAAAAIPALLFAACAPTYAPHLDAPSMPTLEPQSAARCTLAELDVPPRLPDVDQSQTRCPRDSGFVACFTPAQEAIRQRRFKLLHDDRDYCRDAYGRARESAGE